MLVREHVGAALRRYFERSASVGPVGALAEPIRFAGLAGRAAYDAAVAGAYAENGNKWLTPAELFRPYYARAIARYLLDARHDHTQPLRVEEVGGGRGALAAGVLDFVSREAPEVYAGMEWVAVEQSEALASAARQLVRNAGHEEGRYGTRIGDATERRTWGSRDERACFVVALEVLDNLPHDRVWRPRRGAPWEQTRVAGEGRQLVTEPLEDGLLGRAVDALQRHLDAGPHHVGTLATLRARLAGEGEAAWVPTGCLALLEALHDARPSHRLLVADFDALPDVRVAGWCAPLVASQPGRGATRDHGCVTADAVLSGEADVLFPTDFSALGALYASATGGRRAGAALAGGAFMREHAADDLPRTTLGDGFRPLVDDFPNTQVFLS